MFWNLLSSADSLGDGVKGCSKGDLLMLLPMIAIFVLFIWWSRSSQKKREKEVNETLNAMKPGDTVKTIGGICGVVVELCPDEDAFVLETGSETSGKSYIKFDKKAVFQTSAVAKQEMVAEVPVEEADETPVFEEEVTEVPVEEADETPVFEEEATETPVEETAEEAVLEEEVAEEPVEATAEEVVETPVEETETPVEE